MAKDVEAVELTELERARAAAISARRAYVSELERRQALELQIATSGILEAEHHLVSGVSERSGRESNAGAVLFPDRVEFPARKPKDDGKRKPKAK